MTTFEFGNASQFERTMIDRRTCSFFLCGFGTVKNVIGSQGSRPSYIFSDVKGKGKSRSERISKYPRKNVKLGRRPLTHNVVCWRSREPMPTLTRVR